MVWGRSARTVANPPPRPTGDRQCTETARTTGSRCAQWARKGGTTCATHTGDGTTPASALTSSVAVVQMESASWQTWRFGSRAWQAEAWRQYDICGQLRFVANWVANSVSRCRLFVATVDDSGEPAEEATDPDIATLAAGPLGSGPAKDEALRLLGVNLFVAGEAYVVAESDALDEGEDRWFVVSGRQIRKTGGNVVIRRSQLHGGGEMIFRPDVDLILRVWTPHPADTDEPDSPTRSAIPDLREIEALRKREFAELDSRLAGAGMLPLPEGIDYPRSPNDPDGVAGFQQTLMRAMSTSLRDRSSAEALAPIMFTVPGEFVDRIKPVYFWSDLSDQILPLRESAIRSLAQSLDVPGEILTGMGESNHWCADDKTEIFTEAGWVTHDQVKTGDLTITLDIEAGVLAWQPVTAVNRWTVDDEPMLSIEGPDHSSLTTLAHRWPVLDGDDDRLIVTSADLTPDHRLIRRTDTLGLAACEMTHTTYSGTIWCPTTPAGTWLARRNGTVYYTGNSAWQVAEDTIRTQIAPLNARIAEALTTGYLRTALELLGKEPDSHVYGLDTSPLTAQPDRTADALTYYNAGLISEVAAVERGAFREDEIPDDKERLRRLAERLLLGAPSLAADPILRELVGIGPVPETLIEEEDEPGDDGPVAEPATPPAEEDDEAPPDRPTEQTAALLAVSNLAVLRALSLAGGRLVPHRQRDRWPDTPRHALHTRLTPCVDRPKADTVLAGAWDDLPAVNDTLPRPVDVAQLRGLLHGFAAELLTRGMAYDPQLLRELVSTAVRGRRLDAPIPVAA